jgi:hypothetical protein
MGNIGSTPEEKIQAKYRRITRKANRKARKRRGKSKSVHAVSSGLPTLGKRR